METIIRNKMEAALMRLQCKKENFHRNKNIANVEDTKLCISHAIVMVTYILTFRKLDVDAQIVLMIFSF